MEAIAKALHLDTPLKRYMPSISREMAEYLKTFEGLDYLKYSQIITQKLQVNQNIYFYKEDIKAYYQSQKIIYMDPADEGGASSNSQDQSIVLFSQHLSTIDILIVQVSSLQHVLTIGKKEVLKGLKFCPFCQVKRFDTKSQNYSRAYERHIVKCEQSGVMFVKTNKLDDVQKPYCPHIAQNKTFTYLLATGSKQEFTSTKNYIIYDLETVEKIVNKSYRNSNHQISELVPLSVACTIKNIAGVKTMYFDLRGGDDFIKQWLQKLFEEAVIVQQDNQNRTYLGTIDKNIQYNVDVPVIGFSSSKFDLSLIIKNLQCADWQIRSSIGISGVAKQIVVQQKKPDIKFLTGRLSIDTNDQLIQTNGQCNLIRKSEKGVFPYEYINID
ncbi:MAG: hypothetical protein EZS28_037653, partial [Streblomastix strix]